MNIKETSVHELAQEIRRRGCAVVVISPEDMTGYGDPKVPKKDRLGENIKYIEEALVGASWDIIGGLLGANDGETP